MKKKLTILISTLTAALILSTGCAKAPSDPGNSTPEQSSSQGSSSVPENSSGNNDESSNSGSESGDSAPTNDKGEPTFLICPDGTPVYTSEITEIYTGSDFMENDDRRDITLEEAEKLAKEGGDFTVICSGFVYGFIPENAFNRIDDPDLFGTRDDVIGFFSSESTEYYGYTGAPVSSAEYVRFNTGDKIGALTVKSASVCFGNAPGNNDIREYSDKPANFLRGGSVEFDGELELSGYVSVSSYNEFYGTGGDVTFYPDPQSCTKLPVVGGHWDTETGKFVHSPVETFDGYYGDYTLNLGNINDTGADMSGLNYGDTLVKASVVVENIGFEFHPDYDMTFQNITLKDIRF